MGGARQLRAPAVAAILAAWAVVSPGAATGDPGGTAAAGEQRLLRRELANGLRVVLWEAPATGEVAVALALRAGSSQEPPGRGGLAHLVEHLSFHGTAEVGSRDWPAESALLARMAPLTELVSIERRKGEKADFPTLVRSRRELSRLRDSLRTLAEPRALEAAYRRCGAPGQGASTGRDFILYWADLPAAGLECALDVEAARLAGVVPRGFFEEQEQVLVELRERSADPGVVLAEGAAARLLEGHPYARSNWGTARDIQLLTLRDVEEFTRALWHPGNAVLVLVGDLEAEATARRIETLFGSLPGRPPTPTPAPLPAIGPTRIQLSGPALRMALAWRWPPRASPDLPALTLLAAVLEERLQSRSAGVPDAEVAVRELAVGSAAGSLTLVEAKAGTVGQLTTLEEILATELAALGSTALPAQEIARARDRLLAKVADIRRDLPSLAQTLALLEVQGAGADGFFRLDEELAALDGEDLRAAARTYLVPDRLASVWLVPGGAAP